MLVACCEPVSRRASSKYYSESLDSKGRFPGPLRVRCESNRPRSTQRPKRLGWLLPIRGDSDDSGDVCQWGHLVGGLEGAALGQPIQPGGGSGNGSGVAADGGPAAALFPGLRRRGA